MEAMNAAALRAMAVGDAADMAFGGTNVPVDYDADRDEFVLKVRPLETDRARLIVGARHMRARDEWRMPATRAQAAAMSGVFSGRLDPTEAANLHVQHLFQRQETQHDTHPDLFDYQHEGVHFLVNARSALLGDDMGLGKTIMTIEWLRILSGTYGCYNMVICPNSMKFKWASEIKKWWPEATPIVIDGNATKRRKQIASGAEHQFPVFIINYEGLRSHTRLAPWGGQALTAKQKEPKEFNEIEFRCIVTDEAHKLANPKAQQTMAAKQIGRQSEHRLALTGTPVRNSPDDLWSIMNFVVPAEYGSREQFRNRYCVMSNAWHGGYENQGLKPHTLPEFDQFFQPRFLRRTKPEVLKDLPEKMPIEYVVLPFTGKQRSVYNALTEDMMVVVDGELLTSENPLSLTQRLRQCACATPVVNEEGEVVALSKPSNKLDWLLDVLEGNPGEPLVVYAESRKFIEFLARELAEKKYTVAMVTGAVKAKAREKAVQDFQDGKIDVFLGTFGAGAEGLTLTRSNSPILIQQSWAHGDNTQAIDRTHRISQTRGVIPRVVISEGSIDHAVDAVDRMKEGRLQQVVRDPEWLKKAARGEIRP